MKTNHRNITATLLAAFAVAALVTNPSAEGGGRNSNPRVMSSQSHAYGKTYSEWAAAWWQWAIAIPNSESPLFDETGENCDVNQSGPVWFLAGAGGSGDVTVTRSCTVPAGKALFFPIANVIWVSTPGDPPIEEIRPMLEEISNEVTGLFAEVDGREIRGIQERFREQSVVFDATLPEDNLFGVAAGVYGPNVDDGYYLLLPPLPPGEHIIHFGGSIPFFEFSLDVTYHITITP